MKLDVVVTDPSGKPISGLARKDFTVLDNGEPRKVLSFHAFHELPGQPEPPVEVIFLIDAMEIPADLIRIEQNAVEAFLREKGGHLAEPVSIYTLVQTGLWQVAEPSINGNALAAQVAHHKQVGLIRGDRGAAHGDLSMGLTDPPSLSALQALGQIATAERRKPGRKLLLWVGPGWGVGSGTYVEGSEPKANIFSAVCWFSTLLREARLTLYSFSVGENGPRSQFYTGYLHGVVSAQNASFMNVYRKVLAVQSGGRVLDASYDLVRMIESCVNEAGTFYTLSFDPPHADHFNEYNELQVKIDQPGLTARTNTGYYDQPYYYDQPEPGTKFVTVQQLDQMIDAIHSQGDAEVAKQLSTLVLTERLSGAGLASLTAEIHGKKSRQSLVALADASAFLHPPLAEVSTEAPPPDAAAQRRMISLAADYLRKTMPKLPDFFAARTTVHYEETGNVDALSGEVEYEPLRMAESFKEAVLYRNGRELAEGGAKHRKRRATDPYLITYGTFGPALGFVHDAIASPDAVTWSRWETDLGGRRAVFHYVIPKEKSLYQFAGCCLPDGDGTLGFSTLIGYHGEIAVDPVSGAVLRLQAEADLGGFTLVDRSDIMVAYGPVQIGGQTYICPLRSVSIMRLRSVITRTEWDEGFRTFGPYLTMVNDIRYEGYHMYRGESRMMPGYQSETK